MEEAAILKMNSLESPELSSVTLRRTYEEAGVDVRVRLVVDDVVLVFVDDVHC